MIDSYKSALAAAFVLASTSAVFAQSAPVVQPQQSAQFLQAAPAGAYASAPGAYAYAPGAYAYANGYQGFYTSPQNGATRESFGGH